MRLENKIAIVTGGGSGFGEGIVRKFAAEGAKVLIADRNLEGARRVAESIGEQVQAFEADVASQGGFESIVDATKSAFGGVHILVNNAGVGHLPQPLESVEEDVFDRVAAVNMKAIYFGAKAIVPLFKAQTYGAILNVASTGGVSPRPNLTWYNASKGWAITATRGMAVELAPFGIRVNAINPVAGDTPLLKTFMGEDTPDIRAKFLSTIPIGRFSTPEDMGNAACFLCSDEASMVTGVAMEVDGGRCI
ncbi:glucose 1-dehydrogenase [Tianweitania sp. BSSL-BM11]|uniref:Glucose 1-dehydrogenase n=1 Tax=Tianweitania aestuarii TaxID=2814886 RepID=A0ABS5RTL4_9HYPH|nr:glucose 1-dehydrogenase [Tianweitania aestuarii]MBS9720396.1 glucose 1-dehydrogenase [Tianweitania aestuarii]